MKTKVISFGIAIALVFAPDGFASFQFMQVEQVIAGFDGDPLAQAIQLRMRADGQNLVSGSRLRVWNAAGKAPVMVLNLTSDVFVGNEGSRILLATPRFIDAVRWLHPSFTPDFTLAYPIPEGNLAAGRLTFETDSAIVLWSFAWGGGDYNGSNAGTTTNDADGDFGPPFAFGLPTSGRRGVVFRGLATAPSTTNAADYRLSADPATVTKNNGTRYVIGLAPEIVVEHPDGSELIDGDVRKSFGPVKIGRSSDRKIFTITNIGTRNLTGLKIRLKGPDPEEFIVSQPEADLLGPGGRTTFKVKFHPSNRGTRKAAILLKSNDSDENPFDIKLTGFGKAP